MPRVVTLWFQTLQLLLVFSFQQTLDLIYIIALTLIFTHILTISCISNPTSISTSVLGRYTGKDL